MLTPARVYAASPEALFLEKALLKEPAFSLAGSSDWGPRAKTDILSLTPDLLILDSALPGLDGLALLDGLRESLVTPPRILFLCRMKEPGWMEAALKKGADDLLLWPEEKEGWAEKALACARLPLPRLAAHTQKERDALSFSLLEQLQVSKRLKGFSYLCLGTSALACAPRLGVSFSQGLYPYLAHECCVSPLSVERACRTAVEHTWLHGNLPAIQALFGFSVDADRGKPTNAEFFSMLAEHVRREMEKRRRI